MEYCRYCGSALTRGAKFCQKCGKQVKSVDYTYRQTEYAGKIYKCPNCGEVLSSFVRNCPSCGLELREKKATSAVREFALKLEAIESRRDNEYPKGWFSRITADERISKTDEQKISLIQNFSIPNTKEDILEFMILATSNVDSQLYNTFNSSNAGREKAEAINRAWLSKIKQAYEKAKMSYGNEADFKQVQELYDSCNLDIAKAKKKGVISFIAVFGGIIGLYLSIFFIISVLGPGAEKKELKRLEAIEQEAEEALKNGEYKKALLNAEALIYRPGIRRKISDEIERQWDIKRELLLDRIIEEAEKNGVHLERTTNEESIKEESKNRGFVEGFKEGIQPGLDKIKESFDNLKDRFSDSTPSNGD